MTNGFLGLTEKAGRSSPGFEGGRRHWNLRGGSWSLGKESHSLGFWRGKVGAVGCHEPLTISSHLTTSIQYPLSPFPHTPLLSRVKGGQGVLLSGVQEKRGSPVSMILSTPAPSAPLHSTE